MRFDMTLVDSDLESLILENLEKKFSKITEIYIKWSEASDYVVAYVTMDAEL